jgi:hypothetical protein
VLGELLWQLAKLSEGGMIITVFTLDGISVLVTETLGMHEMHLGGKHMAFSSRVWWYQHSRLWEDMNLMFLFERFERFEALFWCFSFFFHGLLQGANEEDMSDIIL